MAAPAGVLVHAGFKLVPLRVLVPLWRGHRGEAVVPAVTVVATSLFEGVLVGLLPAVARTAWDISHVHVETVEGPGVLVVRVTGNATFLRLPKLLDALDALPADRKVELELSGLRTPTMPARPSWRGGPRSVRPGRRKVRVRRMGGGKGR